MPTPHSKSPRPPLKFVILTYAENMAFANETRRTLRSEWGVEADVVVGYSTKTDNMAPYQVVLRGFVDKILAAYTDHDVYYLEDDVRFTSAPMARIDRSRDDVVWAVYRRRNGMRLNKPSKISIMMTMMTKSSNIVGAQAIYFSRRALRAMRLHLQGRRMCHPDGYFSRFIRDTPALRFRQLAPKIGYEQMHVSRISKMQDWRKYTQSNQ